MGHNSRFKAGPSITDALALGATHIAVHCHEMQCLRKVNVEIAALSAPRNIAVNHLRWKCDRCRGINVSVALVIPKETETPLPLMDVGAVKPARRRCGCGSVAKKR